MKRRFLFFVLSIITMIQGIGILPSHAQIPEECEELEFDTKYRAEPGEVR